MIDLARQIRTEQDVLNDLLTQREIKRRMLATISRDLVSLERRIERLPKPLPRPANLNPINERPAT